MFNDNGGGAILYFLLSGNSRKYNASSPLSLIFFNEPNFISLNVLIMNSNNFVYTKKIN